MYSEFLSIDQFLPDSLLRSVMVELLQLQEGATVSPVLSLELLLLIAINGVKMVQCSVEKQKRCSPSLFSDCLMVVSTLVRPEAHPSLLLDKIKVLLLRVSPLSSHMCVVIVQ